MWPWFSLGQQSAMLAIEAQQVMAMRLAMLATGDPRAQREAMQMVTEKMAALATGNALMFRACAMGDAGRGATNVMRLYRRRVSANRRRLAKS